MEPLEKIPLWGVVVRDAAGQVRRIEDFDSPSKLEARITAIKNDDPSLECSRFKNLRVVPDRTLPSDRQIQALCGMLTYAFVALRNLSSVGKCEAAKDLAAIFRFVPDSMFRPGEWDWNVLDAEFRDFTKKYPGDVDIPFSEILQGIRQLE